MPFDAVVFTVVLVGISILVVLFWLLWRIDRKSTKVPDSVALWNERSYPCPGCGTSMEQGWVLLGKGAIWSARSSKRPGAFSMIGDALDNTISLSLLPASNMAWRCPDCRLLLVDHSKLVRH